MTQWIENILQWVENESDQWFEGYFSLVDLDGIGAYVNYSPGYSTVWGNADTIFLGTFGSGLKYIDKINIIPDVDRPMDVSNYIADYLNYPQITSDNIKCIHGSGSYLMCCTESGVDFIKQEIPNYSPGYRYYTNVIGAKKCFVTSTGKSYYTVSGTTEWYINSITCLSDWSTPDYTYVTGSGILASGIAINDIFVTEGTSSDNVSNILFLATSSGVYMLDEGTMESNTYYSEVCVSGTYNILKGNSNNLISIWVLNGKMYISSEEFITVVDLDTNQIYDWYSQTHAGRAGETLQSDDIVDINIL